MKRTAAIAGLVVAALLIGRPAPAQTTGAWLHVRVEEPKQQSKVSVNLPMTVVEAALKAAPEKIASHGRIHLGSEHHGLSVADLRRMWTELRATGDTELVSVEEKDEIVRIARVGDVVQIRVQSAGKKAEEVHADVPVALLDALLSGEGDELNVQAALAEIRKLRGDIVRVKDDDSTVRIWIDEGN